MAYIQDLQSCSYIPLPPSADRSKFIAVGWLERGFTFETGSVEESFFLKLCQLSHEPWQPFYFAGLHECNICQFPNIQNSNCGMIPLVIRSTENLFIPGSEKLFVAPVMIVHYIAAHHYKPPEEFIKAVYECPEMKSMAYLKQLVANGGSQLVRNDNSHQNEDKLG